MSERRTLSVWKVQLNTPATQDYANALKWTTKTFGPRQAETYAAILDHALDALRAGPNILGVKRRDDIAPGILTLHVARNGRKGRHFIVFRIGGDNVIDVLRLLHDSMDLPSHLPS
jgi:toxin ParE1/3/4